jgi:iron complex transport system ATP-binding protein
VIDVEEVAVSLGGVSVLEGVSLSVEAGEFVGLVGPNGAGKTTLLRTVNGDLAPDDGTVRVAGDPVASLSSKAASRRVATVPQDTGVRFGFDVEDVVAMGRTPHRSRFSRDPEADAIVPEAMARTEVAEFAERRVDEISGGERQRVFLARALAQDAPALVLDEPTASLDVNHANRTLELVRDLATDGHAVLAAIHDLEAAARYCDRIAVLHEGCVLEAGPPDGVISAETLRTAFDAESVVTTNPVTGAPAVTALPVPAPAREGVHVVGGGARTARVVTECRVAGFEVSAGPLPPGDTALDVCRALDAAVVRAPPFATIPDPVAADLRDRVESASAVVVADADFLAAPLADAVATGRTPVLTLGDPADLPAAVHERARAVSIETVTEQLGAKSPARAPE